MALAGVKGGVGELLRLADGLNSELESRSGRDERSGRGQFATPSEAAWTMASLVAPAGGTLRVVDPGAGAGALMLALVASAVRRGGFERLSVELVETDRWALELLETAVRAAGMVAEASGLGFEARIVDADFCDASSWAGGGGFDAAILNPPYMKLAAGDSCRLMVRRRYGVDCPNLYAAFVAVAAALLRDGGQLVAITPRSFANGRYFTDFRRKLTDAASFRRVVLFERHFPQDREGWLTIDCWTSHSPLDDSDDSSPPMFLKLTARGEAESADFNSALGFFDVAHRWIVEGFTEITTSEAHKIWRRLQ